MAMGYEDGNANFKSDRYLIVKPGIDAIEMAIDAIRTTCPAFLTDKERMSRLNVWASRIEDLNRQLGLSYQLPFNYTHCEVSEFVDTLEVELAGIMDAVQKFDEDLNTPKRGPKSTCTSL